MFFSSNTLLNLFINKVFGVNSFFFFILRIVGSKAFPSFLVILANSCQVTRERKGFVCSLKAFSEKLKAAFLLLMEGPVTHSSNSQPLR